MSDFIAKVLASLVYLVITIFIVSMGKLLANAIMPNSVDVGESIILIIVGWAYSMIAIMGDDK